MTAQSARPDPMVLPDADGWRDWLEENEYSSDGVWLLIAKKGKDSPTKLTIQQALEEALCSGWIDGQRLAMDERSFIQRYTPRRARSVWSQRNVEMVERLASEGRMRPRGRSEIERAQADGRWQRAYPGQATAQPPAELLAAFEREPSAREAFERLSRTDRYMALQPLLLARTDEALAKQVQRLMTRLTDDDN